MRGSASSSRRGSQVAKRRGELAYRQRSVRLQRKCSMTIRANTIVRDTHPEDPEDLVAGDVGHEGDAVGVTKHHTDLRGGHALLGQLADHVHHLQLGEGARGDQFLAELPTAAPNTNLPSRVTVQAHATKLLRGWTTQAIKRNLLRCGTRRRRPNITEVRQVRPAGCCDCTLQSWGPSSPTSVSTTYLKNISQTNTGGRTAKRQELCPSKRNSLVTPSTSLSEASRILAFDGTQINDESHALQDLTINQTQKARQRTSIPARERTPSFECKEQRATLPPPKMS